MSSLAEVDEEHTVVKLILASFVDYEDAETDRKTHLKSLFGKHESVKVYYGYSQMQLQETESKLREEKLILLRSRNSSKENALLFRSSFVILQIESSIFFWFRFSSSIHNRLYIKYNLFDFRPQASLLTTHRV